jgi:hypothetical protein
VFTIEFGLTAESDSINFVPEAAFNHISFAVDSSSDEDAALAEPDTGINGGGIDRVNELETPVPTVSAFDSVPVPPSSTTSVWNNLQLPPLGLVLPPSMQYPHGYLAHFPSIQSMGLSTPTSGQESLAAYPFAPFSPYSASGYSASQPFMFPPHPIPRVMLPSYSRFY